MFLLRALNMDAPTGTDTSAAEKPVLEPLLLSIGQTTDQDGCQSHDDRCPCLLCDDQFAIGDDDKQTFLKHILKGHKMVIADVKLIANFKSYILYWKQRLKEQPLTDFCSAIQTETSGDTADDGEYFLLSDVLPEDKQLREFLQKRKLESVLARQQMERDDATFSHKCLFCKEHFEGNRADMFNHMAEDHSFNVGLPDNLVFTNEFLEILTSKLSSLQCLYCEKTFRDKTTLKEHMRKKQHRKINPKNMTYDRFYIINYLELGKNWETIQQERDNSADYDTTTESEDEWSGWEEEAAGQAVCLYCDFSSSNPDKLRQHMQELHDLDLQEVKLRLNLNFYQQVKLINYIRRQIHLGVCYGCREKYDGKQKLTDHMHTTGHTQLIPDMAVWDQPEYYFPTYENDNLLCQLEDEDDEATLDCHGNETVIAEDTPIVDSQTILTEEALRREILKN